MGTSCRFPLIKKESLVIHPDTEIHSVSDEIGVGIFATKFLPKGTITWVQDKLDLVLSPSELSALGESYAPVMDKYTFRNAQGQSILCWDHGRYMNHNCNANSYSPGLDFEIAVRDIQVGEEIYADYAALNIDEPFDCLCGAPNCRHAVSPEDFERFASDWDLLVREAFPKILELPQALWPLVNGKAFVRSAIRDPKKIPSILAHLLREDSGASKAKRVARTR